MMINKVCCKLNLFFYYDFSNEGCSKRLAVSKVCGSVSQSGQFPDTTGVSGMHEGVHATAGPHRRRHPTQGK